MKKAAAYFARTIGTEKFEFITRSMRLPGIRR